MAGFCRKIARHPARRRLGQRGRRRPRHPGRDPPGRGRVHRRGGVHPPARRRQVPQDRRGLGLPLLGRPARRRRVGDQRAVDTASRSRSCATAGATGWCSGGDVIEPSPASATRPKKASGTTVRAWPDAKYFDAAELPRPNSSACCAPGRADARPRGPPRHRGRRHLRVALRAGMRGYLQRGPASTSR